jgi:hypothetical protein
VVESELLEATDFFANMGVNDLSKMEAIVSLALLVKKCQLRFIDIVIRVRPGGGAAPGYSVK